MADPNLDIESLGLAAMTRHTQGKTSYPLFVLELERLVDAAEARGDERASELRRLWGRLEIVNALSDQAPLSADDQAEVSETLAQLQLLLSGTLALPALDIMERGDGTGVPGLTDDLLAWLEAWFASQCDGDWEHGDGIKIETLDNPGWSIAFRIPEGVEPDFELVTWQRAEDDWLHSSLEGDVLVIACAANRLRTALELARRWLSPPAP